MSTVPQVFIYGLFHQERCIYVGSTGNPARRMNSHAKRFKRVIRAVPEMRILRTVSLARVSTEERKFIYKYRKIGQADFNKNSTTKEEHTQPILIPSSLHRVLKIMAARRKELLGDLVARCLQELIYPSQLAQNGAK